MCPHMPFYSYWHQKQLVVMRPNACLTPFTTTRVHLTRLKIWERFIFFFFFFFFPSFTDCRYPVGIIDSKNTTLRHSVHSSFKKKKKKYWHITGMKRLGDDEEKIWRLFLYLCHHPANHSELKGAALFWKVEILLSSHIYSAAQKMVDCSEIMKLSVECVWIHATHTCLTCLL